MSYRNEKLLRAAKDAPCMYCGAHGTTVAAHANSVALGKGVGCKAPDFYVAYLCQACHDLYDGRRGKLTKEERDGLWATAFVRTVRYWFENGIVVAR